MVNYSSNLYVDIIPEFLRMCQLYFMPNLNDHLDSATVFVWGCGFATIPPSCRIISVSNASPTILKKGECMKFFTWFFMAMLPVVSMAEIASVKYTDDKVDSVRGEIPVVNTDGTMGVAQIWVE